MKKALVATLVAVSLFGSAKVANKEEQFWLADTKYECTLENTQLDVTLLGSQLLQFGNGLFTHIDSEYDIYSHTDKDGTFYIALMKSKEIKFFNASGEIYIPCKKK